MPSSSDSELRENISDSFRFGFVLCDNLISEIETQLFNGRRCRSHSVTISPPGHIIISQVFYFSAPEVVDVTNETRTLERLVFYRRFIFEFFLVFSKEKKGDNKEIICIIQKSYRLYFFLQIIFVIIIGSRCYGHRIRWDPVTRWTARRSSADLSAVDWNQIASIQFAAQFLEKLLLHVLT